MYEGEPGYRFPFGSEFQKSLLRILFEDPHFAHKAIAYLQSNYFENEVLAWVFNAIIEYKKQYNAIPSIAIIFEQIKRLDPTIQAIYNVTLDQVRQADLSCEEWLRDNTIDFIKRNIFVRAFRQSQELYNKGNVNNAFETVQNAMDKINATDWVTPDREFFFDEFEQRYVNRMNNDPAMTAIATGIPRLDHILGGGLSKGELGIWVAYPKRGKSTILINHGVEGIIRNNANTLHIVLEGSRELVATRYDSLLAQDFYNNIKNSNISSAKYKQIKELYEIYARRLVIRGFTERWDYTIVDIFEEIRELKKIYNWVPDLILVDYIDLLRGRGAKYDNETANQRAATRDLKSLAGKGYAIWSASQAQRPPKDVDNSDALVKSRSIADCYDKIRVADFIGSLNQTASEREQKIMRVFAELYRDNEANEVIPVYADFRKMLIAGCPPDMGKEDSNVFFEQVNLGYTNTEGKQQSKQRFKQLGPAG